MDVFSFGIILCEIISRAQADPDFIPRNDDFGLNRELFYNTFCRNESEPCPEIFVEIAFLCCNLNPDKRPSFRSLQEWFDRICIHCTILGSFHIQLPSDLVTEIYNFNGECNSPEAQDPTSTATKLDNEDVKSLEEIDPAPATSEISCNLPQPVTFSPHLAKDFNANGDRIRDSWRARRKQKIRENRQRTKRESEDINNVVTESIHSKKLSSPSKSST